MNGKQSGPDFEEELDEYLRGPGLFLQGWATELRAHCSRSKLIPLLIELKLNESGEGLAFVFLSRASKH